GETHGRPDRGGQQVLGVVAGLEAVAPPPGPVDEGVHGLAVGTDLGQDHLPVVVGLDPGFAHRPGPPSHGGLVGGARVVDQPGQVVDAVAVEPYVLGDGRIGVERAGDD